MRLPILILLSAAMAFAGETVFNPLQIVFKDGKSPRGAYAGGYAGSKVKREKSLIRFSTGKAHQLCVIAFNAHQPISVDELGEDVVMRLRIRGLKTGKGILKWGWRRENFTVTKPSLGIARQWKAGEWMEIDLPAPSSQKGKMHGLFLQCTTTGDYELDTVVLGTNRLVSLDALDPEQFLKSHRVRLTGKTAPNVDSVKIRITVPKGKAPDKTVMAPVKDGAFSVVLTKEQLTQYETNTFMAYVGTETRQQSVPTQAFVYPKLSGKKPVRITLKDGKMMKGNKPFAYMGINYTDFQMPYCRSAKFEKMTRDIKRAADWGITFFRLTMNLSMIQSDEGVFPDNPKHKEILAKHRLNTRFIEMLDMFFDLCAEHGIYVVVDWHETPTKPYRYFVGADPMDKKKTKPGTAIAWLCPDKRKNVRWDLSNPRHLKALTSTHAWMATHLKDRSNVIGFEVPYNEPHQQWESNQANWTKITAATAKAVKDAAPHLLTFTQNPNFAHNTEAWAFTWLNPFGVDGQAPHHYIANGPIPVRPDAKKRKMPWLARDIDKTFALSIPSLFFPAFVWRHPMYNGEGGEHGAATFMPDTKLALAEEYMYEASVAQCYAAGLAGHVNWTMLSSGCNFDIYPKIGPRFAKVMKEGPVDWSKSDVAVIQNTEAVPSGNGHNFACVPFVELMLSLHLGPVHYLTDDYLIFNGLSRRSLGLEQASDNAIDFSQYKALVVDTRNLDLRVKRLLDKMKKPILWIDDMAKLTPEKLEAFLEKAGAYADSRSPAGMQIAVGPKHVVLYRRKGESGTSRIYPNVKRVGAFRLVNEEGETVFSGTSAELKNQGFEVNIDKWRSLILEIKE